MDLRDIRSEDSEILSNGTFDNFGMLNSEAPGQILSFYENTRFKSHLNNQRINCVITREDLLNDIPKHIQGIMIVRDPKDFFWSRHEEIGTGKALGKSRIGSKCNISELSYIAPRGVTIGDNVTIQEFVSIKEGTVIGDNVLIQAGSVIGCMGLQSYYTGNKRRAASHFGDVRIGDDVILESNVTILKGVFSWESTSIGSETWICGNTYISHADRIGERVYIGAGVTIAGACSIDDDVTINTGAVIYNQVHIGKNAVVSMGTVVRDNIDAESAIVGEKIYNRRLYDAMKRMPGK